MKFHALVIDDDPAILEDVNDRLEALGHSCDCAGCMTCAREHLAANAYSYILLDLQIPVRYGRKSRLANGQNLLREVRGLKGYEQMPIIVMTTHGHDSPDLAVEVFRGEGASDFVRKPFPDRGHTLEQAVCEALATSGRARPGAATRNGTAVNVAPVPFECGEMVFSPSRIELCEVKICGGSESGLIRRILDELRKTNGHGKLVRYAGSELAELTGCARGQMGVAEAVRDFRNHLFDVMLAEANIKINRRYDVIYNDRRYGYRLSSKITVCDAGDCPPPGTVGKPSEVALPGGDEDLNPRQLWALAQLAKNGRLQKAEIVTEFKCSSTTAERDLRDLRRRRWVEFVGPAKTGHWRLVP